jgi:dihydrofolate reductase
MLGYWNTQNSPFKEGLNNAAKYVVSQQTPEPLPWPNSTRLSGDVIEAVSALKREPGADLCIMGSGQLIQTLLAHGLVDDITLFIHPIVLGNGRRLFPTGGPPASFRLTACRPNTKGVIMARYHPVNDTALR